MHVHYLGIGGAWGTRKKVAGVTTDFDPIESYTHAGMTIVNGVITAVDLSAVGGGVSDHDDLGNLGWTASGHTGTASRFAWFGSGGAAEYVSVGTGLSVSANVLSCTVSAGTLDHASLTANLLWTGSGHTGNANHVPYFSGTGAASTSNNLTFDGGELYAGAASFGVVELPAEAADKAVYLDSSKTLRAATATSNELNHLSGVTSSVQTQLNNLSLRVCGRLTLESGAPFSTSNQTAKTTIYWVPYNGPSVPIYDSTTGDFINRSSTGCDVAVPSTLFRLYDIFGYWTGSVLDLETTDWAQTTASVSAFNAGTETFTTSGAHGLSVGSILGIAGITGTVGTDSAHGVNGRVWKVATVPSSTTFTIEGSYLSSLAYTSGGTVYVIPNTRATALSEVSGIKVKSGDSTRTYLGTGMTTGTSGQTEMSFGPTESKLLLWNMYNQVPMTAKITETASHSYTTAPWRYWNANPANRILFVNGQLQPVQVLFNGDGQGGGGYSAAGLDSVGGDGAAFQNGNASRVAGSTAIGWLLGSAGVHQLNATEYGASGWSSTYVGLHLIISM